MKYLLIICVAIFFGSNTSKVYAKEIIPTKHKVNVEKEFDLGVETESHQKLTLVLKDPRKIIKVKYFIRKNKLIWVGFKPGANGKKIITVKVPNTKIGYWIRRLRATNLFSSVTVSNNNTIIKPKSNISIASKDSKNTL